MTPHHFVRHVAQAITQDQLLPEHGVVVVACSGGADSLALLMALHELCGRPAVQFAGVTLHVAHLDHGLRGVTGSADAAFVAAVASDLGVPYTLGSITVADRDAWRGSVEANARVARYRFLRTVAQQVGATRIATGHTRDDQAETVLMHFLRGSGLAGLAGMRPRSAEVIRPLLALRRADTVAYCAALGLLPREDESNADSRYTRNRVRRELLPLLETYQAGIIPLLARNAEIFAADSEYLAAETVRVYAECVLPPQSDAVTLSRPALRALPLALRRRVVLRAAQAAGGDDPEAQVTFDSIARLDRVVMDRSGARRMVQLANGVDAVCHGQEVLLAWRPARERYYR